MISFQLGITPFQVSCLVTTVLSFIVGFFVYFSNRISRVNQLWSLVTTLVGGWSLFLFGVTYSTSLANALYWQYALDAIAIMIPVAYFNFILYFLNLQKTKRLLQLVSIIVGFVVLVVSFTPLFKLGVSPKFDLNFWVDPGSLYLLFPLLFALYTTYSAYLLLNEYFKTADKIFKQQLRYTIVALALGFGGGATNFFPQFFSIYPFGNYLVAMYGIAVAYAIFRHHLFSVRVIATELFSGLIVLVSLVDTLLVTSVEALYYKIPILVSITFFAVFLIRSVIKEVETRERAEKLATDLDVANTNLAKLLKMKSEFLNLVSHQLRTPLTAVVGFLEWWKTGEINKLPPEKQKEMMNNVVASADRLHNVVEDILTVLKVQSETQYKFEQIDLIKNVKEAAELVQPIYAKKGLTLETKDLPETLMLPSADQRFLKQVWINLIDNAAKYTEKGGTTVSIKMYPDPVGTYNQFVGGLSEGGVKLSAEIAPTPPPAVPTNGKNGTAAPNPSGGQEKWVYILIKDTGIGLDQDDKNRLFKQFSRGLEANKMNTTGSGLGLYLVKEIIDAHAGTIEVQSEGKGKGSTFVVGLKL